MKKPTLVILCDKPTERLKYAAGLVVGRLMDWPFRLQELGDERAIDENERLLNYSSDTSRGGFRLPNYGLLADSEIKPVVFETKSLPNGQKAPFCKTDAHFPFDILSASFYAATEYYHYYEPKFDTHSRYDENQNPFLTSGLYATPFLHEWADELKTAMLRFFQIEETPFDRSLFFTETPTIDVDNPWLFLNKGALVSAGGLVKDLKNKNLRQATDRINSLKTNKDPNYTFDKLSEVLARHKPIFFWLLGGYTKFDNRFTLRNKKWIRLIQQLAGHGAVSGIHPSYLTMENAELLAKEKETLEKILDAPVVHSRQHYLRYRLPHTFRNLEAAGVGHEFTTCFYSVAGFKHGLAAPFPWFDLEENRTTALMLHPTQTMDRTFQKYTSLAVPAAINEVLRIRECCRKFGGNFTPLFHNEILSEYGEWQGWSPLFYQTMKAY